MPLVQSQSWRDPFYQTKPLGLPKTYMAKKKLKEPNSILMCKAST
jgi:hypothetical protein